MTTALQRKVEKILSTRNVVDLSEGLEASWSLKPFQNLIFAQGLTDIYSDNDTDSARLNVRKQDFLATAGAHALHAQLQKRSISLSQELVQSFAEVKRV